MKIGDKVEIINSGHQYTTFKRMAKILKAKYFHYGYSCQDHDTGTIKNNGIDMGTYHYYLVELEDQAEKVEIIMNSSGLKIIKNKNQLPEELFEI